MGDAEEEHKPEPSADAESQHETEPEEEETPVVADENSESDVQPDAAPESEDDVQDRSLGLKLSAEEEVVHEAALEEKHDEAANNTRFYIYDVYEIT